MLLDLASVIQKYKKEITGIIQVGAHFAEEHDSYKKMGVDRFIYIEPCQNAFDVLMNRFKGDPEVYIFQFAAGSEFRMGEMFTETMNQGQSNSLLKPAEHLLQHPDITFDFREQVVINPLISIMGVAEGCNVLVMDTQGYELEVLKGAGMLLDDIEVVYTEVNRGQVYEGCAQVQEIDEFLWQHGFVSVAEYWATPIWGDKIYIRMAEIQM